MVVVKNESNDDKKIHVKRWQFRRPCIYGGVMRGASPDGAHPWHHAKPLDAAIRKVPTPYCPDSHNVDNFDKKKNTNKTQLLPSFLTVDQRKKSYQILRPTRDPLLTSLARLALTLTLTLLVKLKSSATF
jgi:hypothetical protein